ncbi:MAG: peptidase S8 [Candidatus Rokuibacteriota bacterium]|nr:MAG: peptidase S8 [Candidatus Rokubacteria bacterium]
MLARLLALLVLAGSLGLAPAAAAQVLPDQYIVVLHDNVPRAVDVAQDLARRYRIGILDVYENALKGFSASIPAAVLNAVARDSRVRFISEDRVVVAFQQTIPTGVNRINAENKTNTGAGINVAVIDTGIDTTHPELQPNIVGGKSCIGAPSFRDLNGHGSHVAGTIAAVDNGTGVVGVAPGAKLWAVQVLNFLGSGSTSTVVCGIDFVDSKSPAKGGPIVVANMSLGGGGTDDGNCGNTNNDALHKAICQAVADGVTFVVAAGNSGADLSGFVPAAYNEVISVTALGDSDGQACGQGAPTSSSIDDGFASFSNFGSGADLNHVIAGPGVDIYSTYKFGGYATLSGTSMASPHVAGAAALYVANNPGATPAQVLAGLQALGEPPGVNFQGECSAGGASHVSAGLRHPEPVVRADGL